MKWLAVLCMLLPIPSPAEWVLFDACGLVMPTEGVSHEVLAGKAKHIGPYLVWAPSVQAVLGFKEPVTAASQADCTRILVGTQTLLVVGSVQDVMTKLQRSAGR